MWKSLERGEGLCHTTEALDNILTGVGEGETQVHGQRKCLAGYDGDMCLLKDKPGERVRGLDNLTVKAAPEIGAHIEKMCIRDRPEGEEPI